MSAAPLRAGTPVSLAPRPAPAARPRLRVVRAPQQARTRVPFVFLCMAILGAALL